MSLPKCEHGMAADDNRFNGRWNAPFSQCLCCGIHFPYIDSGSMGDTEWRTRTWTPKNRCQQCGGAYVEEMHKFANDLVKNWKSSGDAV